MSTQALSIVSQPISLKRIERMEKKLFHYTVKGIQEYQMIQPGDKVLCCVSGGKDSLTMALMLKKLQVRQHRKFELVMFTLDQMQPGWDDGKLRTFYESHDMDYVILQKNTYKVVTDKIPEDKTYCSLCSRLRRGNIYQYAREHGFNKIALGHHRDDLIHTVMMSMMFNGRIQSMPPKLLSDTKEHIVIRPLCFVQEADIEQYSTWKQLPIIPCTLCGSQPNLMRQQVKDALKSWTAINPKIPSNMLKSLQSVNPSHLMDKSLWDFHGLEEQQARGQHEQSRLSD